MSDEWKKHDRACSSCHYCGAELYEKFWGNGGWVRTEKATGSAHGNCVKVVSERMKVLRVALRETRDALKVHASRGPSESEDWEIIKRATAALL